MGKKQFKDIRDLREERKRLDREIKKASVHCTHTSRKNGKVTAAHIDDKYNIECKQCNTVFNGNQIPFDVLNDAARVLHNALNQIKVFSNHPEEEKSLMVTLGEIDFNLGEIVELYKRLCSGDGKKKNKNKNKNRNNDYNDSYGGYGQISVIGGKGKKKNKKRF